MAGVRRDLDMATTANKTFPLFDLPAEIRAMVYSHIILPRHNQTNDERPHRTTPADERYYEQRRICHNTAKSLLLTCKQVNMEATDLFYKHKTALISTPGDEFHSLRHTNKALTFLQRLQLHQIRHIEFDIRFTLEDVSNGFPALSHHYATTNIWLRNNLQRLSGLQTVTFKLGQDIKTMSYLHTLNFDLFNVKHTGPTRVMASMEPGCTSWSVRRPYRQQDVEWVLDQSEFVYQYADGLSYKILPPRQWGCTKLLCSSFFVEGFDAFMLEMKFEKGDFGVEESDAEEDTMSDASTVVSLSSFSEYDMEDEMEVEHYGGIIQGCIDDYDMYKDE